MPLKALLENKPFYAWDLNTKYKKALFFCPICGDGFIPIIETKCRIMHFRHKNNEAHCEPETPEHMAGKRFIFEELSKLIKYDNNGKVILEHSIGNHVTDVFLQFTDVNTWETASFAIEFQCSSMPIDEFHERCATYRSAGARPIWFLGNNYHNRKRTPQLAYEINSIHEDVIIRHYSNGKTLDDKRHWTFYLIDNVIMADMICIYEKKHASGETDNALITGHDDKQLTMVQVFDKLFREKINPLRYLCAPNPLYALMCELNGPERYKGHIDAIKRSLDIARKKGLLTS